MGRRYVLTGGPSSGKTSIIKELERRGEIVIHEAASDCARKYLDNGEPCPFHTEEFQREVFELQEERERLVPEDASRVFIDRSPIDGLAYADPGWELYPQLISAAVSKGYEKVFFLDHLGFVEDNGTRHESIDQALELSAKILESYKKAGYEPQIIPVPKAEDVGLSIKQRTEDLLSCLG